MLKSKEEIIKKNSERLKKEKAEWQGIVEREREEHRKIEKAKERTRERKEKAGVGRTEDRQGGGAQRTAFMNISSALEAVQLVSDRGAVKLLCLIPPVPARFSSMQEEEDEEEEKKEEDG